MGEGGGANMERWKAKKEDGGRKAGRKDGGDTTVLAMKEGMKKRKERQRGHDDCGDAGRKDGRIEGRKKGKKQGRKG